MRVRSTVTLDLVEFLGLMPACRAETKITVTPAAVQVPRGSSDANLAITLEGVPRESDDVTSDPIIKEAVDSPQPGKIQYALRSEKPAPGSRLWRFKVTVQDFPDSVTQKRALLAILGNVS